MKVLSPKNPLPILIFFALLLSSACGTKSDASLLEQALQLAGSNRPELEKVLQRYSTSSSDSLKYRSAVFLIENMPYYYSYKSEQLALYQNELYQTAIDNSCTGEEAFGRLEQKYGPLNPAEFEKVYDVHVITADYLISNIEHAFKVWKEKAWGKYITFDDFCEQILPYRVKNEPLDDWREAYYNCFQPVLDSLLKDNSDPVSAIHVLWDTLHSKKWILWDQKPQRYPYPSALNVLENRIGNCFELSAFSSYVMRALGIPGGTESYLQFPYGQGHHLWSYITDSLGNIWEFSMSGYRPRPAKREKPIMGRVFRRCFGAQRESLPLLTKGKKDLPPLLNTRFIKDVSENYLHNASITIKASRLTKKDDVLYLCTFGFDNWAPVAWCIWKDGKFTFSFVEKGMLYLPAYYIINGEIIPAGAPCYVNQYGFWTEIPFDMSETQSLTLSRKYPRRGVWENYNKRIVNGKFQMASDSTFTEPVTLHTIKEVSDMQWKVVVLPEVQRYRYIRYLSGDDGHCNMAEVQVFDDNGRLLRGSVIGTEGSYMGSHNNRREAVFDGNPRTFFDAIQPNGAWAGLDLGEAKAKAKAIRKISYLFRNDDNNIRIGDTYELFFWNNKQWQSLGRQTAEDGTLIYDGAPLQALFWLHNHTRGKEELPFFYSDGEQVFWEK
jgi:hypothetical protein